jgi:hypothetical protein
MPQQTHKAEFSAFPSIYTTANEMSRRAQTFYFACVGMELILILAAAVLGSIAFNSVNEKIGFAWATGVLAVLGIAMTILIRSRSFEQDWYDGRAIAESIKTRSWRYLTRAEPYELDDQATETKFIRDITEVGNERPKFISKVGAQLAPAHVISDEMRSARLKGFEERKVLYLEGRIEDQRAWYASRSRRSRFTGDVWFGLTLVAQIGMLIACFAMIQWPEMRLNIVGMLSALSASLVAWVQIKRFQELSHSYGLAAKDLTTIAELGRQLNEQEFSSFVLDAENAISREHTLWKARRDSI